MTNMIRPATSIECKLEIGSRPSNNIRFLGVHDAALANVEGGASQQAHVILVVLKRGRKIASINSE